MPDTRRKGSAPSRRTRTRSETSSSLAREATRKTAAKPATANGTATKTSGSTKGIPHASTAAAPSIPAMPSQGRGEGVSARRGGGACSEIGCFIAVSGRRRSRRPLDGVHRIKSSACGFAFAVVMTALRASEFRCSQHSTRFCSLCIRRKHAGWRCRAGVRSNRGERACTGDSALPGSSRTPTPPRAK